LITNTSWQANMSNIMSMLALAGLMEGVAPQAVNSADFLAAIRTRLERRLEV